MKKLVPLDQKQLKKHTAKELLILLRAVCADGKLADEEIDLLNDWLESAEQEDLPALPYLRKIVNDVLADHEVTEPERKHLACAIIQVLPEPYCRDARLSFGREALKESEDIMCKLTRNDDIPASALQKDLMRDLKILYSESCSFLEACNLICDKAIKHWVNEMRGKQQKVPKQEQTDNQTSDRLQEQKPPDSAKNH